MVTDLEGIAIAIMVNNLDIDNLSPGTSKSPKTIRPTKGTCYVRLQTIKIE